MSLENWLKVAETAAIIAASVTAIIGIGSWRRELRGKKRYELAEETLSLFYRVKDVISAIRSPFGHTGEGTSRPASPGEDPEQKKARDLAYSLWERYLKHEETFNRLRTLRYQCMAILGKEAAGPFDDLNKIVQKFAVAVDMLSYAWGRMNQIGVAGPHEKIESLDKIVKEHRAVFWEGMGKPDPINEIVSHMIKEAENLCVPILSELKTGWISRILRRRGEPEAPSRGTDSPDWQ